MANLYTFSLQAVYLAGNNGDGTFSTAYKGQSSKTLGVAAKLISDKAEGNSHITSIAAQTISADLTLDTAGFDDSVLSILLPVTPASSNSGSNFDLGNVRTLYVGLIAQCWPDTGDVLHFFPRCKITADFTYKLEYGKIVIPQFKLTAIQDDNLGFTWRKRERPSATATTPVTFPPAMQ